MQFWDKHLWRGGLNLADVFGQTASYLLHMSAYILEVRSSLKIRVPESSKKKVSLQTLQQKNRTKARWLREEQRRAAASGLFFYFSPEQNISSVS